MSKRYYLCDRIGTGTAEDPYRPAFHLDINQPAPNYSAVQSPSGLHFFCIVATQNQGLLRSIQGVDALPDFPLDGRVAAIETNSKAAMKTAMTARGLPTGFIDNTDGYREVIRRIGQDLTGDPNFNENNFDVSE